MTASASHPINLPTVSDADRKLNAALVEAQAEFPSIPRDRTVSVRTQAGGSYSFSYAPLETILNAVRPVLAKHGLALVQRLESPGGTPALRTELRHKDGGVLAGSFPLTVPDSPQALGSLLTYLRRYAISAILCLAAEEDDDGQQASERGDVGRNLPSRSEESLFQAPQGFDTPDDDALDITDPQRRKIYAMRTKLLKAEAFSEEDWQQTMSARYGTEKVSELTKGQASDLINRLQVMEDAQGT